MIPEYMQSPRSIAPAKMPQEDEKVTRMRLFRERRNQKLAETDWTQMPDAPLTPEQKEAWAAYRQALRNVPATVNAAGWVTWPTKPAK
jgi:hypothetical protein